jgi:probable rRNA maturation factor
VEGEVIVSADTAAANAVECGWPAAAEQLLCVTHGSLHLVGYDDATAAEKRRMRAAEARILRRFGIERAAEPAASRAGCSPNASL